MKKTTLLLLVCMMCCAGNKLKAQTDDNSMKAWQAYMTPGDMQKMLAKADGNWNGDITMWMSPDAPPTKSKGTCTNKMILGGRYQESISKGAFEGMPFEGRSIIGYDNLKKVFVSCWIDNMGTGMMNLEGKWDEATKTISFTGMMVDPMSGADTKVHENFTWIDNNKQKLEMFIVMPDGKEMKTMEILYTRAK